MEGDIVDRDKRKAAVGPEKDFKTNNSCFCPQI